jgi:2-polyprenyl-3-methyl-5-hydroxy-6-metoxy-1,4-benzoquinol methylase
MPLSDAIEYADRTSIVRASRLPIPGAMLKRLGWRFGQKLVARFTPAYFELAAAADGNLTLVDRGVVGKAQNFRLTAGDVVAFEQVGQNLRVTAVDGREHDSYRKPSLDDGGVPIPPSWLTQAFTAKPNAFRYLEAGVFAAEMIIDLAAGAGCKLTSASRVLDFGCGAGRVARALRKQTGADIVGYDLYTAAIDWCRAHMPYGRWEYGQPTPPIDEADNTFDLIIAISVLTHLDQHHQDLWLAEWKRLLRPGGNRIASFKSEPFLERYIPPRASEYAGQVSAELAAGGFAYIKDAGWAGVFPDFYNDSFHTVDYVRTRWGREFEIVGTHLPETFAASRQDVAVLRKRPPHGTSATLGE